MYIGIPIGIVTAIAAPASLKVEFKGDGGHAGAVLMPNRYLLVPLVSLSISYQTPRLVPSFYFETKFVSLYLL